MGGAFIYSSESPVVWAIWPPWLGTTLSSSSEAWVLSQCKWSQLWASSCSNMRKDFLNDSIIIIMIVQEDPLANLYSNNWRKLALKMHEYKDSTKNYYKLEFKQVIKTCLDFSIANGGTIRSYSAGGPDKCAVYSRTTHTKILLNRAPHHDTPGAWQIFQLQNATGKQQHGKQEIIHTKAWERLLECLTSFWDSPSASIPGSSRRWSVDSVHRQRQGGTCLHCFQLNVNHYED